MHLAILSRNKKLHSIRRLLREAKQARVRCDVVDPLDCQLVVDGGSSYVLVGSQRLPRYDAVLLCDDAHGTGTLGKRGTGLVEETGMLGRVPIVISTFSKTFGGIGGILLGSNDVVDFVKHNARSFLFSATLPVPVVEPR
jgi:glycine C-acetyltransferase